MNLFHFNIISESKKVRSIYFILKRFKHRKQMKNDPCKLALKHYDDFYNSLFGEKWPSVRLALLSTPKKVAVINNFGDIDETIKNFTEKGAFNLKSFLEEQKNFIDDVKNESKQNEESRIHEIITQQQLDEEERESQLHPEGMEFKSKVDSAKEKEAKTNKEYVYKPEDARTSLRFDLQEAEIDETRLISPDGGQDASLNEFIPATKLKGVGEYVPESEYYKYYQPKISAPITVEKQYELEFPEELKVLSFDRGDISNFPNPRRNILQVYNYLKVDGGELLTALVLGAQPNDKILDMCSPNGNIAYCIFQTFRSKFLVCTSDRNQYTESLFSNYVVDFTSFWNDMLCITQNSIDDLESDLLFDKVLVHVPSTNDRTSLYDGGFNIFHIMNVRDRLQLPITQCSLLMKALKLVRPGGTVVYTTETLSPVQNDGVVNQALTTMWQEENQRFTVMDLSPALRHMSIMFNFGDYLNLKFGTLIVPFVPVNFGPRYICKIVKNEERT